MDDLRKSAIKYSLQKLLRAMKPAAVVAISLGFIIFALGTYGYGANILLLLKAVLIIFPLALSPFILGVIITAIFPSLVEKAAAISFGVIIVVVIFISIAALRFAK